MGIFISIDKTKYEGQYVRDKKNGFGVYTFTDGRIFEGWWVNGKQHGLGVMIAKGKTKYGVWDNGKRL